MNKKKLIFLGLDVLVLIVTIGVSLAVFNYVKKGENSNRVTAGAITMNFTEGERNISLPVATPTSDEEGRSFGLDGSTCQNDGNNNIQCYTDFTISTNMSIDYSISYEVTLEKDEETTLNNDDVRIYLEKQDSEGNYKEVFTPKVYTEIDSENLTETDELGATNSEMLLDSGEITKSTTYNYRLRIWLSSDYTFTNETKDFVGKINVYGSNVEVNSANGINLTDNGTDINGKTITMQKGNTKTISAEVLPDNTKNKNLIWESSDTNKVKIDSAGNITAVEIGTSVITISTSDKSKSATFTINVVNYDAKSVELNTNNVTLSKGNTYQLTSIVTPTDAEDTRVTYTSSSDGIATITKDGLITAVGTGETTIIVETMNGYTDTCKVIVTEPNVSSIVINGDDNVDVGSTIQLSTTITSDSTESSNVVWTSSDESKAIVSSTGKVTGISTGSVTVTAYIKEYSDIKATKTIEVQYPEIKTITMSSDMTINYGNSTTFSIWISPNQVRNQDKIRWISSNTSVAAIASNCSGSLSCTIDGVSSGSATIKAVVVKIVDGEEVETSILDTATLTITEPLLSLYIKNMYNNGDATLFYDGTSDNNLRYYTSNPNNYVNFNCDNNGENCQLWRIIGVMNNIKSTTQGVGESRVKIIYPQDLYYSYDRTENRWEDSDIMKLLNPNDYWYDKTTMTVNNSLWYNRTSGTCYVQSGTTSCDFSSNGLRNDAKKLFTTAYWNLGAFDSYNYTGRILYSRERESVHAGSNSQAAIYWLGEVGLPYPSDGWFSSKTCVDGDFVLYSASGHDYRSCGRNNGWFNVTAHKWTMMPRSSDTTNVYQLFTNNNVYISSGIVYNFAVNPTLYLKANVILKNQSSCILNGTTYARGSEQCPFDIALGS